MQSDNIVKRAKLAAPDIKLQLDINHTKTGVKVCSTFKNSIIYLNINEELRPLFRFNRFASSLEISKRPPWGVYGDYPRIVEDKDIIALKKYLIDTYHVDFPKATLDDGVVSFAHENSFDPVYNYLTSLKWDGKKRLDSWLTTYLGVEPTDYSQVVGRMTLAAACARINKPGIKYDYMLILEGPQDIGKSMAVATLGGQWYRAVSLIERTKETVEKMQGAFLIEVPELAVFKKKDIESLKAFITNEIDVERFPYGRRSVVLPRRSIFIGTINPDNSGYFSDTTGNRRFLPVTCGDINLSALQQDKDQIWAEAWAAHLAGCPLYLSKADTKLAQEEQERREIVDEWTDPIRDYIEGKWKVTAVDIWCECLKGFTQDFDRLRQMRVADCMRKLGWVRKVIRVGEETKRGFVDPNHWKDFRENDGTPWDEEESNPSPPSPAG